MPHHANRLLRKPPAKAKTTKQQTLEDRLKEAMKHPGVAEVMRVYQSSLASEETFSMYQYFQTTLVDAASGSSADTASCQSLT